MVNKVFRFVIPSFRVSVTLQLLHVIKTHVQKIRSHNVVLAVPSILASASRVEPQDLCGGCCCSMVTLQKQKNAEVESLTLL
jgi:hypothetical protein